MLMSFELEDVHAASAGVSVAKHGVCLLIIW